MEIIRAQTQANRFNTSGPFGSTQWQGNTQVTNLSPEMEALQSQMFNLAGQSPQQVETPDFLRDIAGGMMSNVGQRYGVGAKPGQPQSQPDPAGVMPSPAMAQPGLGSSPQFTQAPDFAEQARQIREMLAARQNMEQR
jgi:hypothetical protein